MAWIDTPVALDRVVHRLCNMCALGLNVDVDFHGQLHKGLHCCATAPAVPATVFKGVLLRGEYDINLPDTLHHSLIDIRKGQITSVDRADTKCSCCSRECLGSMSTCTFKFWHGIAGVHPSTKIMHSVRHQEHLRKRGAVARYMRVR